ncbi:enoyl-CoA hydratase/isomerase family protein [Haloprofundus sp. MHR1]|uniref:enoyl-CoA hydratase/isomerase family protein n=1 Tax=Haloprofundus sp. MHR1 TaxID=2572921 RepID=UPI0010BEF2B0|nr:enoyl-CoA hydratase-related protein [Haloprofundus sp. MHR1]QCJ48088.1 enoyl-CoA hydratase [Haloprofundus sp. MHR1]
MTEDDSDGDDDSTESEIGTDGGTDAVLLDRDAETGVATITLNNPGLRNALTVDVADGLIDALDELEGSDTRCVVVTGSEGSFSAGGDVNAMMELQSGSWSLDEAVRHIIQNTGRCVQRLAECEFPTVAKIEGVAVGAGANVAIACDVQLMSEEARMGFGFRQVGLAVDSGTSYLLPRLVGDNVAKELVFTGELLDAERALDLGLVNHVYSDEEFDERVDAFVEKIAEGPTVALRTSKRLLDQGWELSLSSAIANEAGAQSAVFETTDHTEGVESFMGKRSPDFRGE